MKSKHFILIVLVIALVGEGLWWFMRPKAAAPEKTAEATVPAKVEAPKPLAPPVIAPAVATPATKAEATPVVEAPPPNPNDPQADLKTAIPDIARLEATGDTEGVYEKYTPPDELDPKIIQRLRMVQQQTANVAAGNPQLQLQLQQIWNKAARAYEALENQTPTYNEAGDEATYMYSASELTGTTGSRPVTFVKINGKWYEKPPDVKGAASFSSLPGTH